MATHILATLLNCSNKFRGKNVMRVYLDDMTWLVAYTYCFFTVPLCFLGSKYSGESFSLTKTVRGGPGGHLREKRSSRLKEVIRRANALNAELPPFVGPVVFIVVILSDNQVRNLARSNRM